MRRFCIFICLSLVLFSLAGCGSGEEARGRKLAEGFSPCYQTDAEVEIGGMRVLAQISSPTPDACEITLSFPDLLDGYIYRLDPDGVSVSYRGLSFTPDPAGAAGAAPLLMASRALSALLTPRPEEYPSYRDGYWELAGRLDSGAVLLRLDDETGLPVKLLLQDGGWEITLDNFVFLG